MATKKKAAQSKSGSSKKGGGKRRKNYMLINVMLVVFLLFAIVFRSSVLIFVVGLLPMFVAFFVDRSEKKTQAITVGAMNIAGCTPFVMELWTTDSSMEKALSIIMDPVAIIIIYAAAGVGYLIDWVVTAAVAGFLYQRGISRKDAIVKTQKEMVERWGEEVSGKVPLDHEGFPLEGGDAAKS